MRKSDDWLRNPDYSNRYQCCGALGRKHAKGCILMAERKAMSNEYRGWTNRETWAVNLWIINNEWIYEDIKALLPAAIEEQMEQIQEYGYIPPATFFADEIKAQFEEWKWEVFEAAKSTEQNVTQDQCLMVSDIGSFNRVDWIEIAKALLASYKETEDQE